jgi:hypothetical protein
VVPDDRPSCRFDADEGAGVATTPEIHHHHHIPVEKPMHHDTPPSGLENGEAVSLSSQTPDTNTTKVVIKPTKLGNRGQYYAVFLGGQTLIDKTRNPTAEACRRLAELGHAGRLMVWHFDRPYPCIIIPDLVASAALTVGEGEGRGPHFVRYRDVPDFGLNHD